MLHLLEDAGGIDAVPHLEEVFDTVRLISAARRSAIVFEYPRAGMK